MTVYTRSLFLNLFVTVLTLALSGCAGVLQDCGKYAGSEEYNLCLAEQGNRRAQYDVGLVAYEAGNMEEAIRWLEKAAEPNSRMKQVYLPAVGGQSFGTIESLPRGNTYPGNREAQELLARIYAEGIGVERDEKKASRYRLLSLGVTK